MPDATERDEPLCVRIGAQLYTLGRTSDALLAEAAGKDETAGLALASGQRDIAVRQAREAASRALDATVAGRASGRLRATAVGVGQGEPAPRRRDSWDEVAGWGSKVTVAERPLGRRERYDAHDTEIVRLLIADDGAAPLPTPRNPGYGF